MVYFFPGLVAAVSSFCGTCPWLVWCWRTLLPEAPVVRCWVGGQVLMHTGEMLGPDSKPTRDDTKTKPPRQSNPSAVSGRRLNPSLRGWVVLWVFSPRGLVVEVSSFLGLVPGFRYSPTLSNVAFSPKLTKKSGFREIANPVFKFCFADFGHRAILVRAWKNGHTDNETTANSRKDTKTKPPRKRQPGRGPVPKPRLSLGGGGFGV